MQTRAPTEPSPTEAFNPLSGWEAAASWNRAALAWMTQGWQQWFSLVTTVRPPFGVASQASLPRVRSDHAEAPVASGERKRAARPSPKRRSGTKTAKTRARG